MSLDDTMNSSFPGGSSTAPPKKKKLKSKKFSWGSGSPLTPKPKMPSVAPQTSGPGAYSPGAAPAPAPSAASAPAPTASPPAARPVAQSPTLTAILNRFAGQPTPAPTGTTPGLKRKLKPLLTKKQKIDTVAFAKDCAGKETKIVAPGTILHNVDCVVAGYYTNEKGYVFPVMGFKDLPTELRSFIWLKDAPKGDLRNLTLTFDKKKEYPYGRAVWMPFKKGRLPTFVDMGNNSRYPHRCSCGSPAYIGIVPSSIACSNSKCRHFERT